MPFSNSSAEISPWQPVLPGNVRPRRQECAILRALRGRFDQTKQAMRFIANTGSEVEAFADEK